MEYLAKFVGGPFDGGTETLPGPHYTTMHAKQLTESGLINMAVYDYEHTAETPDRCTRVYVFRATYPRNEAIDLLYESKTV